MQEAPQINHLKQFLLLFGLVIMGLIIGGILLLVAGAAWMGVPLEQVPVAMNNPANANASRLMNMSSTFIGFLIPAMVYQRIVGSQGVWNGLGFRSRMNQRLVLLVIPITFTAMALSGALGMLNEQIPLTEGMLKQAREMEAAYRNTMLNMARMNSWFDLLLSLVVMALAPAIFEEVLFRGALQPLLVSWTRKPWVGILIASIIFSAVHFSYFGFLPRIALGMILGYLFHYGGNLWYSILLHFLNNGFIVVQLYLLAKQGKPIEKAMDDNLPLWTGLLSLPLLILLFRQYRQYAQQRINIGS